MTGYIVPLDTVSVEIVENSKTGLWVWRALASCSIVGLGQTSSVEERKLVSELDK